MARPKSARSIALEIERSYKKHKKQLEQSMVETQPGSRAHLDHIAALAALDRKYREERSDRGLDPQNLGTVAQTRYVFRATIESTDIEETAADKLARQMFDEEFSDAVEQPMPTLPKANATKGSKN